MTLYFVISLQRKRLSIAVELVANPAIIFMDEPTSGLDGHAAAVVMRCVRAVANMQRTIICTIHQPSAEIFSSFDMLVLLQTGGHTMYCGPLGEPQSKALWCPELSSLFDNIWYAQYAIACRPSGSRPCRLLQICWRAPHPGTLTFTFVCNQIIRIALLLFRCLLHCRAAR